MPGRDMKDNDDAAYIRKCKCFSSKFLHSAVIFVFLTLTHWYESVETSLSYIYILEPLPAII